jgi:hypothetical protein
MQNKKNKDQFNYRKRNENRREKREVFGDLKGLLARRPYGPPDHHVMLSQYLKIRPKRTPQGNSGSPGN